MEDLEELYFIKRIGRGGEDRQRRTTHEGRKRRRKKNRRKKTQTPSLSYHISHHYVHHVTDITKKGTRKHAKYAEGHFATLLFQANRAKRPAA